MSMSLEFVSSCCDGRNDSNSTRERQHPLQWVKSKCNRRLAAHRPHHKEGVGKRFSEKVMLLLFMHLTEQAYHPPAGAHRPAFTDLATARMRVSVLFELSDSSHVGPCGTGGAVEILGVPGGHTRPGLVDWVLRPVSNAASSCQGDPALAGSPAATTGHLKRVWACWRMRERAFRLRPRACQQGRSQGTSWAAQARPGVGMPYQRRYIKIKLLQKMGVLSTWPPASLGPDGGLLGSSSRPLTSLAWPPLGRNPGASPRPRVSATPDASPHVPKDEER